MSRNSVIIAVILMLTLSVIAWFVLPRSSSSSGVPTNTSAMPLLDFTPSDVTELIVEHADGRRDSVFKTANGWRLRTAQSDNADAPSWPIAGAQARGMLTILNNLTPIAQARDETLDDDTLTVLIRLNDGAEHTLRFASHSIGGRRLVQAGDSTPVYLDKPVYEALTSPGPMGWRESILLSGVGVEVSRLTIDSAQGKLLLARVRGVWRLREPVHAGADESAIDQLLTALSSLAVVRWVDNPSERADIDMAAFKQALRFTIERDRRAVDSDGANKVTTYIQLITIGDKANVAGNERYAMLGTDGPVATISASQLLAIEVDPVVYISRFASMINSSQIGVIEITQPDSERVTLTRTLDGWNLKHASDADRMVPDEQVRMLIDLLTQQPADDVSLVETIPEQDANRESLLIQIFGFNHDLLGEVRITPAESGFTLTSDDVIRLYLKVDIPELLSAVIE